MLNKVLVVLVKVDSNEWVIGWLHMLFITGFQHFEDLH